MEPDFECEVWDQDGPDHFSSYVHGAFMVIAVACVAANQVSDVGSLLVLSIWFGLCYHGWIRGLRAEREFSSDRIVVEGGCLKHNFRYTVSQSEFSKIPIESVQLMKVHFGEPISVELIGEFESELFWLPNEDQVRRLERTLLELNPKIVVQNQRLVSNI
ncbi:hypothetical protein [Rubinisphaera margarita]|uniref:hypothetical protein n=1 Tax=Rubinisphaera margarita TaxID=2909586 RepID=UPI001EE87496|nr:hypothetical protein [Rubinisphaera margarita]MCG6158376.1 hypothetical protein [Rubinisphaera margarita]